MKHLGVSFSDTITKIFKNKKHKPLRADHGAKKRISPGAAITLEASILIPLFLMFFVTVFSLFEMLRLQNAVEIALHQTGNEICLLRFEADMVLGAGEELLSTGDESGTIFDDLAGIPDSYKTAGRNVFDSAVTYLMVKNYLDPSSILETPVLDGEIYIAPLNLTNEGEVGLEAVYTTHPYFKCFGLSDIRMEARYYGHDWSGFAVASDQEEEQEDEDPDVYIAKRAGAVYHTDKGCTYLTRNIHNCPYIEIEDKRNKGGAIYYPCNTCGGGTSGTVYYTDYGRRYHSSLDCHQLTRDIITLKLSAAKEQGYRPCSVCAGG
ncbi:hypothetical protein SAMN04487884_13110 [Butyrivibrio fibrisolvens]|uniref:TadE-like protein n=1 Tax=Butyrivibrio fibrisolvens TaxID=831 RepID=A0A1H9WKH9_BUTFI|nr:hypothetical protein [Butyrivibrio fibrisolvens]SES34249.1 hypothetical protein SAMN04487884_13110 [Butyrivibrio fibrisolvens]